MQGAPLFLLALAVLPLTEGVDVLAGEKTAEEKIRQIAQRNAETRLGRNDAENRAGADAPGVRHRGEHDGQHLVRGGKENRQHGADGDGAGREKRRRGAGNAALRHHAQKPADQRAGLAGIGVQNAFVQTLAALQQLHKIIGDEQNRNAQHAVLQGVQRTVENHVRQGYNLHS